MKSGVIIAIVALAAVGAAVPALAQAVDLPPLIANSPADVTVSQQEGPYLHQVSTSDFLVIDDSGADVDIECTVGSLDNSTKAITNVYHSGVGDYGTVWELPDGRHSFLCTATDAGGQTATATHVVDVDIQGALFPTDAAEQRMKRIAQIYRNGVIDMDTYHLIIKYYHRAGLMDFDIVADTSGGLPSGHRHDRYCTVGSWEHNSYYSSNVVSEWTRNNADRYTVEYKQCLETLANSGAFDRLNLGF